MDVNDLRQWVADNDILNKTIKQFWSSFKEFMNTEWTEDNPFALFSEDKLIVDVKEISLKLREYSKLPRNILSEVVEVRLDLHYLGAFMGYYSISYDLYGNEVDNTLEWGLAFAAINQRISLLEGLKNEFERNSVTDTLDKKSIEVIRNVIDDKLEEMKESFKKEG
ncbi:hypothetical protein SDC9_194692 [bioreactor metagenome]|uniref:Uncharacterized protein n=1 Tax=bioreactor metagenome TaxID=1076179 RepID=A0A645I8G4_9ZZZZ